MKVTLCPGYNINVDLEEGLSVKDPSKCTVVVADLFKKTYPYMKRMDPSFFDMVALELRNNPNSGVSIQSMKFWRLIHQYHQKQLKKKIEISKPDKLKLSTIEHMSQSVSAFSALAGVISGMFGFSASRSDVEKFITEAKEKADANADADSDVPDKPAAPKGAAKPKGRKKKEEEIPSEPLAFTIKRDATTVSHFVVPSRPPTAEERESVSGILGVNFISKDGVFKIKKSSEEQIEALKAAYEVDDELPEPDEAAPKAPAKEAAKAPAKEAAKPKAAAKPKGPTKGVADDARGKLVDFTFKDGKTFKLVLTSLLVGNKQKDFVAGVLDEKKAAASKKPYIHHCLGLTSSKSDQVAAKYELLTGDTAAEAMNDESNTDAYNALVEAGLIAVEDPDDEAVNENDE